MLLQLELPRLMEQTDAIGNPYSLIQNATGYTDKLTSVPIDLIWFNSR
jgi:hypothetical protein